MIFLYMLYFLCLKKLYHFFEDYVNSIKTKTNIEIVLETEFSMSQRMKDIIEKDPNYIFVLLTVRNMNIYKMEWFNKNRIFILNTEQLTRKSEIKKIEYYIQNGYKTIDYSSENIEFCNESLYLPYQVNPDEIFDYKKDFDVCYIGNPWGIYRINKIQELKRSIGINVIGEQTDPKLLKHWGNKWGKERDEIAFKHKILVNIHHDKDFIINEQMRINRCIFNKVIVISETGRNDDNLFLKDYIIFVKYEDIEEKVKEVLENYDMYYEKIYGNFKISDIDNHYTEHLKIAISKMKKEKTD